MKRVAHILGELRPSGMEKMLAVAAPFWAPHGIANTLIATGVKTGDFAGPLAECGYQIVHLPFDRNRPFHHFREMIAHFRHARYDALHIHTEQAFFYYNLAARLAGIPVRILTKHNIYPYSGLLLKIRTLQRAWVRRSAGVFVAISESVRQAEWDQYRNPCRIIPNWFDPATFRPVSQDERCRLRKDLEIPEDRVLLTLAGNCSVVKNHRLLFQALALLKKDHPNLLCLHMGEEGQEGEQEEIAKSDLRDSVRFLGSRQNVAAVMRASDIHIQCSQREGFGIAGIEGLAAGLRAVFTRVPGLIDFEKPFPSILFSTLEPASLANAIRTALRESPTERETRATRQYQAARSLFGPETGVAAYAALYQGRQQGRQQSV
jgi:glycosyltransferase involved in cell wall biosynthesis